MDRQLTRVLTYRRKIRRGRCRKDSNSLIIRTNLTSTSNNRHHQDDYHQDDDHQGHSPSLHIEDSAWEFLVVVVILPVPASRPLQCEAQRRGARRDARPLRREESRNGYTGWPKCLNAPPRDPPGSAPGTIFGAFWAVFGRDVGASFSRAVVANI